MYYNWILQKANTARDKFATAIMYLLRVSITCTSLIFCWMSLVPRSSGYTEWRLAATGWGWGSHMTSAGASESPQQAEEVFGEKGGSQTICSAPSHHEPVHHKLSHMPHIHYVLMYSLPVASIATCVSF